MSSRRRFLAVVGAGALLSTRGARGAQFHYRLGLSQPLDSPNYLRLKEMAERVLADTDGAMQIEVPAMARRNLEKRAAGRLGPVAGPRSGAVGVPLAKGSGSVSTGS